MVLAIPVAAGSSLEAVQRLADEVVCLAAPEPFYAGEFALRFCVKTSRLVMVCVLQRLGFFALEAPAGILQTIEARL